ncbi:unnamed protein product [Adineta steineri]|uniref:Uncharacterized protein n=1 Tax=Adineta steineri TaxID=433720 RepID=A0A818Z6G6_9BILA|nr:unnamed protein product [Adineta steineri]CAF3766634.1 unnamed protein product [Adineta steineri]
MKSYPIQALTNKISLPRKVSGKIAPIQQHQQPPKYNESNLSGTVRSNDFLIKAQAFAPLPPIKPAVKSRKDLENDFQSYHDKRICSVRSAITTFIIIIILFIITGVIIGIVFAVINSQNSSGTANNNNQNSLSTPSTVSVTSSVIIGSQTGSSCSSYTQINDPTRSISTTGLTSSCDNSYIFNSSNGGAWIRFVGSGGTALPTSSPGLNHCGGYLSGWYNNSLPTTTNTIVTGTACFETYSGTCGYAVDISVILCPASTNYYVFFLPPLNVCNARYCTT